MKRRPFITFCLSILGYEEASVDEGKGQDVDESNVEEESKAINAEEESKIEEESDDEQDNVPIAASIRKRNHKPSTRKRNQKRPTWEYVPAVDDTAKYWGGGVEGKRTRTMCTASYRDDDARSDSEDDPDELFQPQKADDSSSDESATVPSAKNKVSSHPSTNLTAFVASHAYCPDIFIMDHRK